MLIRLNLILNVTTEIKTEAPTTTKKKKPPKCEPNYQVILLKSEDHRTCLKVINGNSLSMSTCNSSSTKQHWKQLRFPDPSKSPIFYQICFAYAPTCLTAALSYSIQTRHAVLNPFRHGYDLQSWVLLNGGQLMNKATGFRLVAYSSLNPSSYAKNQWRFGLETFVHEPARKWSFLQVQDSNNATLCVRDGLTY